MIQEWTSQSKPPIPSRYERQQRFDSGTKNPEGRSLLTGPIPPTPGYEYGDRPSSAPTSSQAFARVHGSDAKAIHKRAMNGTGVPFLFEVQGMGLSSTHGSAAKPPKNHLHENVRRIRYRQTTKNVNQSTPVKALWRSKQYDHVQSRVKQRLDEETNRSSSRAQSARGNFLHAHENTGPRSLRSSSAAGSRRASISSSIDLKSAEFDDKTRIDYVKLNSQWAKEVPKVRRSATTEMVEHIREKKHKELEAYNEKQKGRVPNYIEKIKEKRAQELYDERMNTPDPDCPYGHVKIDNDKRLSTLRQLELNRADLEKKMSHLPIRNDSLTLRRTKEELEKKIIELDEAIKIFSKPKVFLKMEE